MAIVAVASLISLAAQAALINFSASLNDRHAV